MNAGILKETALASVNGTTTFPEVVRKLLAEGVESYHVDLVRSENRYYDHEGRSHVEKVDLPHPHAADAFSAEQVAAAVRASQKGEIKYPEFVKRVLDAGCVYYIAYLSGKKVVYSGRRGESHTELFPK